MTSFGQTVSISKAIPSQYKNFSCGTQELDQYLKMYAKNNNKKNIGKTFILLSNQIVIGYYTLSAAQISIQDIPNNYRQKLPSYPIPASRLCRLAVDKSHQRRHIGEHLLVDATERIRAAAMEIAVFAIVVDAKNESAKAFYLKYGFMPLENNDLSLFIPLSILEEI